MKVKRPKTLRLMTADFTADLKANPLDKNFDWPTVSGWLGGARFSFETISSRQAEAIGRWFLKYAKWSRKAKGGKK